jgi:hypothetical protein
MLLPVRLLCVETRTSPDLFFIRVHVSLTLRVLTSEVSKVRLAPHLPERTYCVTGGVAVVCDSDGVVKHTTNYIMATLLK